ncbi:hypothetical protein DWV67_14945, partial [Dorea formicigenerans]
ETNLTILILEKYLDIIYQLWYNPFKHYISKILKVCTISNFNTFSRNFQCLNYHNEQAEGILRKLRNSQEESPFNHRRRRILNDKKYESSKGQKNR